MNITVTLSAEDIKSIIKNYVTNNFNIFPDKAIFTIETDNLINCIITGAPLTIIKTKEENNELL